VGSWRDRYETQLSGPKRCLRLLVSLPWIVNFDGDVAAIVRRLQRLEVRTELARSISSPHSHTIAFIDTDKKVVSTLHWKAGKLLWTRALTGGLNCRCAPQPMGPESTISAHHGSKPPKFRYGHRATRSNHQATTLATAGRIRSRPASRPGNPNLPGPQSPCLHARARESP
jgi:hypothetical protein